MATYIFLNVYPYFSQHALLIFNNKKCPLFKKKNTFRSR